jgi:hypothetical protein
MQSESIDLEPCYSHQDTIGRCIKCRAEEKLNECLRQLLDENSGDDTQTRERYELLYSFLQSPDLQQLCDKTEQYLAEGREVNLRIYFEEDELKYKLTII